MPKIIIKDGVRYPEAFATRHAIKGDETREVGAERVRTVTAVGFPVDPVSGALITSGAQEAAGEANAQLTAAQKKKAAAEKAAAEKAAAEAAGKGTDGKAAAGDGAGSGNTDGETGK